MTVRKTLVARTNGMSEILYFDDNNGGQNLHTVTVEDIDKIAREAAEIRDQANWALTKAEPMRHAAKIPQYVLDKAMREGWFNDNEKWRAWANDPDNAIFRTWPGKL